MKRERIIIFDWDDTLFPRFLTLAQSKSLIDLVQLKLLDEKIVNLFNRILLDKQNHLFLVTNSRRGWIEKTSSEFLPQVYDFIDRHNNDDDRFCLISARSSYEFQFPESPSAWKISAFERIFQSVCGDHDHHHRISMTSYGDGPAEKKALRFVSEKNNLIGQAIQFIRNPETLDEIIGELELVDETLDQVLSSDQHLDIAIKGT